MLQNSPKQQFYMRIGVAIVVAILTWIPLSDSDIWWQLASGRLIWQHGVPTVDVFTYTAQGQNWIDVHWLYQVLMYSIYSMSDSGGEWLLGIVHSLCWGLATWVWVKPRSWSSVAGMVLLFWLSRYLMLARPLALTLLLMGLQMRSLERCFDSASKKDQSSKQSFAQQFRQITPYLGAGLAQIIMANIQGLFILGPFYVAWRWPKRIPFAIALYGVSAINPSGIKLLLYPFKLFGRIWPGSVFAERISENVSPVLSLLQWNVRQDSASLQAAAAILLFTLWGVFTIAKNRQWHVVRLTLPWIALAWISQRNIPIALLLVSWPIVKEVKEWRFTQWAGMWWPILVVMVQFQWWWSHFEGPVATQRFPVEVTERLSLQLQKQAPQEPLRIFCAVRYGGYLSWKLYPHVLTHIDGRLILRDSVFYSNYLMTLEHPHKFEDLAKQNQVDAVIIPKDYPPLYRNLALYLARSPYWKVKGEDQAAWWFVPEH